MNDVNIKINIKHVLSSATKNAQMIFLRGDKGPELSKIIQHPILSHIQNKRRRALRFGPYNKNAQTPHRQTKCRFIFPINLKNILTQRALYNLSNINCIQ